MTTDTKEAIAAIERSTRRQHFTDVRHVTVRWEPYKPDGARQMKALGRWQEQVGSGDYWRWQNCERPAFAHDPDLAGELTEARAEIERLKEALDAIRQYGSDTLSGPSSDPLGSDFVPDDRKWQRDGVLEMTRRARAALQEGKSDD